MSDALGHDEKSADETARLRQKIARLEEELSDLHRSHRVLRDAIEKFELQFLLANDIMFSYDTGFRVVQVSPNVERILGYKPDELIGRSFEELDLLHPEDMPAAVGNALQVLSGEIVQSSRYRFRSRDGLWKYGEVSGVPYVSGGRVAGVISVARDITTHISAEEAFRKNRERLEELVRDRTDDLVRADENLRLEIEDRKRTEGALRASVDRYRLLVEHANEGILVVQDGMFRFVNPKVLELSGYTEQELTGRPFDSFIHPSDREEILKTYTLRMQGEDLPDTYSFRVVSKAGEYRWIRTSTVPVVWDGRPATLTFLTDITEEKIAYDARQATEAKYRMLYEGMADGFVLVDMEGRLLEFNRAYADMLGYDPQELHGLTYMDLTPLQWHAFEADIQETQTKVRGYSDPYEKEYRKKDGTIFPVELRTYLLRDDEGRPLGRWAIVRDITERKLADEALRRSEELLRGLTASIPGIVYQFYARDNGEMGLSFVSRRSSEIIGLDNDPDGFFERFYDCIAPEDKERFMTSIKDAVRMCSKWEFEGRFIRPDGQVRYIRALSQPERRREEIVFNGVLLDITLRKTAEVSLKRSEKRFRDLAENTSDLVWETDTGLRFTFLNSKTVEYLGYNPEELLGMTPDMFMTPEEKVRMESFMKETTQRPQAFHDLEVREVMKDGSLRIRQVGGVPVYDDTGMFTGYRGIARDITESRRIEEELRRSEAKHRFLMEKMTDIVWTMDLDLRTTYVSPSITRMLGFTPEERMAQDPRDQLTPESFDYCTRLLAEELERDGREGVNPDRMINLEAEYYHKDGRTLWFESVASGIRDADGRIIGLHGVSRDMSEHKKAEEQLQASEKKFSAAFHASPAPMVITDIDRGKIIDVNEACVKWSGYTRDEAIGRDTIQLGFWSDAPARSAFVSRVIREKAAEFTDFRYRVKSGEVRDVIHSARLIEVEGMPCILSYILDITDQKRAGEELLRHRDHLEEMVKNRTSELTDALERLTQEIETRRRTESALRFRETELQNRRVELEEMNAALKVLLKQREGDKRSLETNIMSNMKTFILPYIQKLEDSSLGNDQMKYISLIKSQIEGITSAFTRTVSTEFIGLTPAEIQVASLIREGKNSKEIARIMNISLNTVHTYRFNIRTKAGLKNNKINLRSYLRSLD